MGTAEKGYRPNVRKINSLETLLNIADDKCTKIQEKAVIESLIPMIEQLLHDWNDNSQDYNGPHVDSLEHLEADLAWNLGEWYLNVKPLLFDKGSHSLGRLKEQMKPIIHDHIAAVRRLKRRNCEYESYLQHAAKTIIIPLCQQLVDYASQIKNRVTRNQSL